MTMAPAASAPRIERLRNDLFDLCESAARLEDLYRNAGWVIEAELARRLFEALEDRMARPYPSDGAPRSAWS